MGEGITRGGHCSLLSLNIIIIRVTDVCLKQYFQTATRNNYNYVCFMLNKLGRNEDDLSLLYTRIHHNVRRKYHDDIMGEKLKLEKEIVTSINLVVKL